MHKHDFDAGGRAVKMPCLFASSSRALPHTLSLGVSIHGSDGHSGMPLQSRIDLLDSRNLQLTLFRRPFIFPSSFVVPLSLSPAVTPFRLFSFFSFLLSRVFPFSAFPRFPVRRSTPCASYSPMPHSAALHNFYRCR